MNLMPRSSKSTTRPRRAGSRLILVLGGASSGKSQAALERAGSQAPKAFVATGQGLDKEMQARIARHRATRSAEWVTAEVPRDLAGWFRSDGSGYRTIVVDCLTLWLSNVCGRRLAGADMSARVDELVHAIRQSPRVLCWSATNWDSAWCRQVAARAPFVMSPDGSISRSPPQLTRSTLLSAVSRSGSNK